MHKASEDIRDIFFENIKKIFLKNKDFYILTNDADVFALQKIKHHKRFVDAGVCEQNLINIASGLAKKKKKVLVYGFCNFLCHRAYEQIKVNIGSMNLPVTIIGIGPGFSFPNDGPTHHGIQDIANIYTIPEFEIINLADNNLADYISSNILKTKQPTYIRLEKGVCSRNFLRENYQDGFKYYKALSKDILVISTGHFSQIAKNFYFEKKKFSLIDIFLLKSFNKKKLSKIISGYKKILIYDENTISGGISFILNTFFLENGIIKKTYAYLTAPENQTFKYYQDRNIIHKNLGIDSASFKKKVDKLVSK
tara:strand:- start:3502 stop:4428 length:927 start_codon:yes stop_codon:yes gene_type:complete